MTEKEIKISSEIRAKAAEVVAYLDTLKAAGPVQARYLASGKRDIATGFQWVERSVLAEDTPQN